MPRPRKRNGRNRAARRNRLPRRNGDPDPRRQRAGVSERDPVACLFGKARPEGHDLPLRQNDDAGARRGPRRSGGIRLHPAEGGTVEADPGAAGQRSVSDPDADRAGQQAARHDVFRLSGRRQRPFGRYFRSVRAAPGQGFHRDLPLRLLAERSAGGAV